MQALIFDTETTGLIKSRLVPLDRQVEIIELYAALVDMDTGEIMDDFDSLFKPQTPINEKSKAHSKVKIGNAMLERAPRFATHAGLIKAIIEVSPLVLAHNVAFDMEMVDIEFERLGQTIQWPKAICTVEQTVHLECRRLSLTKLHKHLFGKGFRDAHRAKADTQALIKCACELYKRGVIGI